MNPAPRKLSLTLSLGLLLLTLTLLLAYLLIGLKARSERTPPPLIFGQIQDFSLTNQAGSEVSLEDLRSHVWIADIIFTRCAGPCLKMSRQMKELQDAVPATSATRLVTLTTDPGYDSPVILAKHAARFGADTNRWMFLTGTKEEVARFAASSLKLSAMETKPGDRQNENDLFIHSTTFVVVDKRAQLRGIFETGGEGVDWEVERKKILAMVKQLEREP
jgi:protein SCO1